MLKSMFQKVNNVAERFTENLENFSRDRSYDPESGYSGNTTITYKGMTYNITVEEGTVVINPPDQARTITFDLPNYFDWGKNLDLTFNRSSNYDPESGYSFSGERTLVGPNGLIMELDRDLETDGEGGLTHSLTRTITNDLIPDIAVVRNGEFNPEAGYTGSAVITAQINNFITVEVFEATIEDRIVTLTGPQGNSVELGFENLENFSYDFSYDPEAGYSGNTTITYNGNTYNVTTADQSTIITTPNDDTYEVTVEDGEMIIETPNRTITIPFEDYLPDDFEWDGNLKENFDLEFNGSSVYDAESGYTFSGERTLVGPNGVSVEVQRELEIDLEGSITHSVTRVISNAEEDEILNMSVEGSGEFDPETGYTGSSVIEVNDLIFGVSVDEGDITLTGPRGRSIELGEGPLGRFFDNLPQDLQLGEEMTGDLPFEVDSSFASLF